MQSIVTLLTTFFWSHDAQNFHPLQHGFDGEVDVPEDEDEELLDDEPVPLELEVDFPLDVEGLLELLLARESRRYRRSDCAKFKTIRLAKAKMPTDNLMCFITIVFVLKLYLT